ncbi:hypothetical protein C8J57DRAFT_1349200 [Mycena rebaudengoi]|nr:hypothetical protein C8J57DRAFT_1349200 [Mycena rebaudengoi]
MGDTPNGAPLAQIEYNLYAAAMEMFFYAINAVLAGCFLKIALTRRAACRHSLYIATLSLFVLCTAHCALQIVNSVFSNRMQFLLVRGGGVPEERYLQLWNSLNRALNALYVTNNLIADGIFTYRCYAIWNFQRKIILIPTILVVISTGLGYYNVAPDSRIGKPFMTFFMVSVGMSVLTNLILMSLMAARIWSFASSARELLGPKIVHKYYTVLAMILESGAIYCIGGVLYLIFSLSLHTEFTNLFLCASLAQLVGIAPTQLCQPLSNGHL